MPRAKFSLRPSSRVAHFGAEEDVDLLAREKLRIFAEDMMRFLLGQSDDDGFPFCDHMEAAAEEAERGERARNSLPSRLPAAASC